MRGVFISAGELIGFTITNGYSMASGNIYYDRCGGGVNAYNGSGMVSNCVLTGCSAYYWGGGMYQGTANNCTISENSAENAGGAMFITANNCIVWFNTAEAVGNDLYSTTAHHTCSPDVAHGSNGCITNAPLFTADFRLLITSPCINAGTNNLVVGTIDRDGNTRILGGTVDMGAYEYDAARTDSDGDGMSDFDEFIADTSPTNAADYFHISGFGSNTIEFISSSNRLYRLYSRESMVTGQWAIVETKFGEGGLDSMSLTNNIAQEFFKLEVQIP